MMIRQKTLIVSNIKILMNCLVSAGEYYIESRRVMAVKDVLVNCF